MHAKRTGRDLFGRVLLLQLSQGFPLPSRKLLAGTSNAGLKVWVLSDQLIGDIVIEQASQDQYRVTPLSHQDRFVYCFKDPAPHILAKSLKRNSLHGGSP
jgi:hypothetical protein